MKKHLILPIIASLACISQASPRGTAKVINNSDEEISVTIIVAGYQPTTKANSHRFEVYMKDELISPDTFVSLPIIDETGNPTWIFNMPFYQSLELTPLVQSIELQTETSEKPIRTYTLKTADDRGDVLVIYTGNGNFETRYQE